ncbi:MAG TPA: FMN-dependent NADH-azoreductase [Phycisphaerales bacterium]|nr:FMN-dependent NADH-azoreductase [Phycisphaerales bacterium]
MATLLYIQASPRIEHSHSIAVASAFVEAYRAGHGDDRIVEMNLFETDLPPFDLLAVNAKYNVMHSREQSDEQRAAWDRIVAEINRFKAADKYVFAVPMWNFSIPWRLKQYIDILVQPGLTFTIEDGRYKGLLEDKSALIVYARGGQYPAGTDLNAFDHQKPYIETILPFIGITDVSAIVIEPTLQQGPDAAGQKQVAAIEKAKQLVGQF